MGVDAFVAAAFALPGMAIGSFLNVVVSRVPLHLPIGASRSRCMSCSTEIAAYDNIPVLSYVILGGRCRACKSPIPSRYPAVEASTALLVVACGLRFGLTAESLVASAFCVVLVALTAIDIEHHLIPNRIVLPAAGVALVAQTILFPSFEWVVSAFVAALVLFVVAVAYPRGLGMGDVKLALLLGAVLGRNVVVALAIGFLLALLPAAWLGIRHGRSARKMAIPLAPFLSVGAVVALFCGDTVVAWYSGVSGL
jgi:leader peptidase (prepilin peptidase) / N-methyltransferase